MNKKFTLATLLLVFFAFTAQAQLPDGSFAPDFTVTDLDGNEWNLYDILDEGKTVIIDAYATWCGPCWNYHQAGTLKDVWNAYGPDGTDEVVVLAIEADPGTSLADIYGTGSNTIGDWTEGVPYPMIDYGAFNDLYDIAFFPTIYMVCPSRNVYEIGQLNQADMYAEVGTCPTASGVTNGALVSQTELGGKFCGSSTYEPVVTLQNFGSDTIMSAEVTLSLNGELAETMPWSGQLTTYQTAEITFAEVTVDDNTEMEIAIQSVNGIADEDASNDVIIANALLGPTYDNEIVTLELTTDNYAAETYWELIDENGIAYYTGGNTGIFLTPAVIAEGAYSNNTTYTIEMALPIDGCYSLRFYDLVGDGICCGFGTGSYTLTDSQGNALITGGEFEEVVEDPFELSGGTEIANNASIVLYNGDQGEFCGVLAYAPELVMQNIGTANITSMTVALTNNGTLVQTFDWTGDLASGQIGSVTFDEIDLVENAEISFEILSVNGEADGHDYQSSIAIELNRVPVADTEEITVEIQTDQYAYETYWQITNIAGIVIASGGNTVVGADGGGARVAAPGDPGAYSNNELVVETVTVPANGCYNFLIVDDWGDGICCNYGDGYYRVSSAANEIVFEGNDVGIGTSQGFEADIATSTNELTAVNEISVFPNPTSADLTVNFTLAETTQLTVDVYNALGQRVQTVATENFQAGQHTLEVNTSNMASGLYFINLRNANAVLTKRFAVSK
jgi:hypothetical protein